MHLMHLISYIVSVVLLFAACVSAEMFWDIEEGASGPFFVACLVLLSYLYLEMI